MRAGQADARAAGWRRLAQGDDTGRLRAADTARRIDIARRNSGLSRRRTDSERARGRPGAQISGAISRPDAPEEGDLCEAPGVPDTRRNHDAGRRDRATVQDEVFREIGTIGNLELVGLDAG